MITPITSAPSLHDIDLHRLARRAHERHIRIFYYPHTREHYAAAVAGLGGDLHRVTRLSCDCAGFIQYGRCTHYAALLDYLGELPATGPADDQNGGISA